MLSQKEIHLRMKTEDGKFVNRTIDITNLIKHVGAESILIMGVENQRDALEEWIKYRGNDQHATRLTLISWSIT